MKQAAAAIAAVAALWCAGAPPVARAATPPTAVPARPPTGAVMVGWHEDGDDGDALRAHESELGTRFALVRMYQQWQVPSRRVTDMVSDGRLVLVSHKPPAGGWPAVASGAEDAMIARLADAYRALGREVLFTFHHEPHDDASDVKGGTAGTAADYLAAWRRIRTIFDQRGASHAVGGNVFFAYAPVGWWALKTAPGGPAGSGDPLYPGDDLIDVLAPDSYNWGSCRGNAWQEFSSEWAPLVALAAAHHKPLIAAEFGSAPGARDDWFRHAATWMRTDPLARQWLWGFAYFHSLHDTCPWDFLNQADGRAGWQDAFRDAYFTGAPFSLAAGVAPTGGGQPPPTPAPPAAPIVKASVPPPAAPARPATSPAASPAKPAPKTVTTGDPAASPAPALPAPPGTGSARTAPTTAPTTAPKPGAPRRAQGSLLLLGALAVAAIAARRLVRA